MLPKHKMKKIMKLVNAVATECDKYLNDNNYKIDWKKIHTTLVNEKLFKEVYTYGCVPLIIWWLTERENISELDMLKVFCDYVSTYKNDTRLYCCGDCRGGTDKDYVEMWKKQTQFKCLCGTPIVLENYQSMLGIETH